MKPAGLVAVVLLAALTASAAPAHAGASGVLDFEPPLTSVGHADAVTATGALLIQASGPADADFTLTANTLHMTRLVRVLESTSVQDIQVIVPAPDPEPERRTFHDATVRVTALRPAADVLLSTQGAARMQGVIDGKADFEVSRHDLVVLDGLRKDVDDGPNGAAPWSYTYVLPAPFFGWNPSHGTAQGDGTLYAWEADIEICAEECVTYQTGRTRLESESPAIKRDRYEYIVFRFEQGVATAAPTGPARLLQASQALALSIDGTARFPAARGELFDGPLTYVASGRDAATVRGALQVGLVTDDRTSPESARATVEGDVAASTLTPLSAATAAPLAPSILAASAVGAGLLLVVGLAGYAVHGRGRGLLVAMRARRRATQLDGLDLDEEPLLHPDRHRLYYLLQRRGVMRAQEAAGILGIPEAEEHLKVLADRGLVRARTARLGGRMRTFYVFPIQDFEARFDALVFLSSDANLRFAELVDAHGEAERETVVEAALRAPPHLSGGRADQVLDRMITLGLAREEVVAGVRHVAPTDALRTCMLLRSGHGGSRGQGLIAL